MKTKFGLILIFLIFVMSTCTHAPVPVPTSTVAPTLAPTTKPIPTATLQPTPTIEWVTLGSPFAPDCGDGIPRIWSNDSFNGPFKADGFGPDWGHVDIFVPKGCEIANYEGELLAPVSGFLEKYYYGEGDYDYGFNLRLPSNTYLIGIEDAFILSGVTQFEIKKIRHIFLSIGHVDSIIGQVTKGQSIGDLMPYFVNKSIGYQITINYDGIDYMFSPTLFETDSPSWPCVENSPYDCEPEPLDYAP